MAAIQAAMVAAIAALPGFNQMVAGNLKYWFAGEGEGR
jgi:predicted phosphohydrolase